MGCRIIPMYTVPDGGAFRIVPSDTIQSGYKVSQKVYHDFFARLVYSTSPHQATCGKPDLWLLSGETITTGDLQSAGGVRRPQFRRKAAWARVDPTIVSRSSRHRPSWLLGRSHSVQ